MIKNAEIALQKKASKRAEKQAAKWAKSLEHIEEIAVTKSTFREAIEMSWLLGYDQGRQYQKNFERRKAQLRAKSPK